MAPAKKIKSKCLTLSDQTATLRLPEERKPMYFEFNPEVNPEVNISLLRKAVEWVEWQDALAKPKRQWDQAVWVWFKTKKGTLMKDRRRVAQVVQSNKWECQTVMCLAGFVALEGGWKPTTQDGEVTKDGEVRAVPMVAEELLGIRNFNPGLFNGENDARDIRRIAEQLAGERL